MRFAVPVYGVRLADVSQLMCTRNSASLSACNGFPSQTEFIPQPSMAVCLASIDCVPSLTVSQSQSPPVDPMLSNFESKDRTGPDFKALGVCNVSGVCNSQFPLPPQKLPS